MLSMSSDKFAVEIQPMICLFKEKRSKSAYGDYRGISQDGFALELSLRHNVDSNKNEAQL